MSAETMQFHIHLDVSSLSPRWEESKNEKDPDGAKDEMRGGGRFLNENTASDALIGGECRSINNHLIITTSYRGTSLMRNRLPEGARPIQFGGK